MTTIATPPSTAPTPVRSAGSGVLSQVLALFSQVFRGIAASPGFPSGVSYIDYLLPAILVTTGSQAAIWSGTGLATDLRNEALARFRTLPISMTSLLVARSLFDLVRNAIQLIVLTLAGVLLGYAPAGGILGTTLAILIGLAVGVGLSWVFIALASWVRNVELMQMVGIMVIFPLMFASSAFVPITGLLSWLRVIAAINPLTYAINASRGWVLADPTFGATMTALLTAAALIVGAAVIASRGVRRP